MTEQKVEATAEKSYQEGEKLYFDSMKHLTTLNTGSILLLVTFLEKLFNNPRWKALIVVSLCSFTLSILFSVSSMLQSANHVKNSGKFRPLEVNVKKVIYYVALITFLSGIISLVVFAWSNLY